MGMEFNVNRRRAGVAPTEDFSGVRPLFFAYAPAGAAAPLTQSRPTPVAIRNGAAMKIDE